MCKSMSAINQESAMPCKTRSLISGIGNLATDLCVARRLACVSSLDAVLVVVAAVIIVNPLATWVPIAASIGVIAGTWQLSLSSSSPPHVCGVTGLVFCFPLLLPLQALRFWHAKRKINPLSRTCSTAQIYNVNETKRWDTPGCA
jgi:hypothetical protein